MIDIAHSRFVRRAEIVAELKFAHDEMARLSDMIPILEITHLLEGVRLRQLLTERASTYRRVMRLHEQLRKLDLIRPVARAA